MGTKDFYNKGNKGLDIKNAPGYIKYEDAKKKYAFRIKIIVSFEPHWICNKCLTPIVLLSLYQSRYNPFSNSIFSNNTLVCFNPDTALSVFLSMYHSDTTRSLTQCPTNNTSVCINPNMMLYVFFSMYRSDTTRYRTQFSTNNKSRYDVLCIL